MVTPNKISWTILISACGTRERSFFIQSQLPWRPEMWCFHSRSLDSSTPRYGWCLTTSKAVSTMLYWCNSGDIFWVTCITMITKHLEVLKTHLPVFFPLTCQYPLARCLHLCQILFDDIQLSTKRCTFDFTDDGRSLIYQEQKWPKDSSLKHSELNWDTGWARAFKNALCWPLVNKCLIHKWRGPLTPIWYNLWSNLWWGTVSKAFEKSMITSSVWLCDLSDLARSSIVSASWESQDLLFLKPCWRSVRRLNLSTCGDGWCAPEFRLM